MQGLKTAARQRSIWVALCWKRMYYLTSSQFFGWAPNIPQNDEKSEASVLQAELYMTSSTNFFMTCFPTVVNFPVFFFLLLFVCLHVLRIIVVVNIVFYVYTNIFITGCVQVHVRTHRACTCISWIKFLGDSLCLYYFHLILHCFGSVPDNRCVKGDFWSWNWIHGGAFWTRVRRLGESKNRAICQ